MFTPMQLVGTACGGLLPASPKAKPPPSRREALCRPISPPYAPALWQQEVKDRPYGRKRYFRPRHNSRQDFLAFPMRPVIGCYHKQQRSILPSLFSLPC